MQAFPAADPGFNQGLNACLPLREGLATLMHVIKQNPKICTAELLQWRTSDLTKINLNRHKLVNVCQH